MAKKKCTKCGEVKPFGEFVKRKDGKDGLRGRRCKSCYAETARAYYSKNREKETRSMGQLAGKIEDVWDELRKDHIEVERAKELFNGAGKIIGSFKARLEYKKLVGDKKKIAYLDK